VKGQPEKMSLEACSKLTATDGRGVKVKRQWVPDNWSCDEEAPPSEFAVVLVRGTNHIVVPPVRNALYSWRKVRAL